MNVGTSIVTLNKWQERTGVSRLDQQSNQGYNPNVKCLNEKFNIVHLRHLKKKHAHIKSRKWKPSVKYIDGLLSTPLKSTDEAKKAETRVIEICSFFFFYRMIQSTKQEGVMLVFREQKHTWLGLTPFLSGFSFPLQVLAEFLGDLQLPFALRDLSLKRLLIPHTTVGTYFQDHPQVKVNLIKLQAIASWLFQLVAPHQCSAGSVASWAQEFMPSLDGLHLWDKCKITMSCQSGQIKLKNFRRIKLRPRKSYELEILTVDQGVCQSNTCPKFENMKKEKKTSADLPIELFSGKEYLSAGLPKREEKQVWAGLLKRIVCVQ